jgi:hypothetical protein
VLPCLEAIAGESKESFLFEEDEKIHNILLVDDEVVIYLPHASYSSYVDLFVQLHSSCLEPLSSSQVQTPTQGHLASFSSFPILCFFLFLVLSPSLPSLVQFVLSHALLCQQLF